MERQAAVNHHVDLLEVFFVFVFVGFSVGRNFLVLDLPQLQREIPAD
jgi:hypothetical protein